MAKQPAFNDTAQGMLNGETVTFIVGHGDTAAFTAYVMAIRAQIETTTSDFERQKLQERLQMMTNASVCRSCDARSRS